MAAIPIASALKKWKWPPSKSITESLTSPLGWDIMESDWKWPLWAGVHLTFFPYSIKCEGMPLCKKPWSVWVPALSVHFWTEAHQTTGDLVVEVGSKSVSHRSSNTLPFEEAVSHLRGAVMARLSPERNRLRRSLERKWFGKVEEKTCFCFCYLHVFLEILCNFRFNCIFVLVLKRYLIWT